MSNDYLKFYRELRAEMELMWGSQGDSNKRIEQISTRIREHGQRIEEQGEQIAEQGRQINTSMKETARLGMEVAALGDQMVGRLKQVDHKFGKFLGALEKDMKANVSKKQFEALEARVKRLEDRAS